MRFLFRAFCCSVLVLVSIHSNAQIIASDDSATFNYMQPREYELAGVSVTGTRFLDESVLINISGLVRGDKIEVPGEKISDAINNLWKQGLFSDIKIAVSRVQGNLIFLEIQLEERPRLSAYAFRGDVRKGEQEKIRENLNLERGKVLTQNVINTVKNKALNYYLDKGFLDVVVTTREEKDSTLQNGVVLYVNVDKKRKVKIGEINISGNAQIKDGKIKRAMKNTKERKWYKFFTSSKFIDENYAEDKTKILELYNAKGLRDAHIMSDSVYRLPSGKIAINIQLEEGPQYYFRNINWVGNTKHSSKELADILNIKKGEPYSQSLMDERLLMSQSGRDVSSLYMDDGYLFFNVTPVEVNVENDSIDLEMRIYEGKQAIINKVSVSGNTKTNDRVVMREIRTKPGQLFSRTDITRTIRELAQLGYFDQEKIGVNPKPDPTTGTVDLEYTVEEKPSDQLELQGGYGNGTLVGSLGVTLNNWSMRNAFKSSGWKPIPSGDGQRISARIQSNGKAYQLYSLSFTEPWLGGSKPNSLSVSGFRSIYNNDLLGKENPLHSGLEVTGGSIGLGKRLKWPDDYFTIYAEANYNYYSISNYSQNFLFADGYSHNINAGFTVARKSIDAPIYPRSGSDVTFSLQLTPPYSLINKKDYSNVSAAVKYKFIEYHKWKFSANWFSRIVGDLVLNTSINYGFLGLYNRDIGGSPFERYYLGGDGLSGYSLDGREVIRLRGYDNNSLSPSFGGTIFEKYTLELRHPVTLNPSATIFLLAFAEGGNSFVKFKDFNPFSVKRSAGFGIRIFLPVFGLLGLDWGHGYDNLYDNKTPLSRSHFHFSIGQTF